MPSNTNLRTPHANTMAQGTPLNHTPERINQTDPMAGLVSILDPAVKDRLESRVAFLKNLSDIDPSFKRIFESEFTKEHVHIDPSFKRVWEVAAKKNLSTIICIIRRYLDAYPENSRWVIDQIEHHISNSSDQNNNQFDLSTSIGELLAGTETVPHDMAELDEKSAEGNTTLRLFNETSGPNLTVRGIEAPFRITNDTSFLGNTSVPSRSPLPTLSPYYSTYNATNATIAKVENGSDRSSAWVMPVTVFVIFFLCVAGVEIRRRIMARKEATRREATYTRNQNKCERRRRAILAGDLVEIELGDMGKISHVEYAGKDEEEVAEPIERGRLGYSLWNYWRF